METNEIMSMKLLRQKLSGLKGVEWCIVWGITEPYTDTKRYDFYIRDWSKDEEVDIFLMSIDETFEDKNKDFYDEFLKVIQVIKSKGYRAESFNFLSLYEFELLYDLETSTLRRSFADGSLGVKGIDYVKKGSTWFIAEDSKFLFVRRLKNKKKSRKFTAEMLAKRKKDKEDLIELMKKR